MQWESNRSKNIKNTTFSSFCSPPIADIWGKTSAMGGEQKLGNVVFFMFCERFNCHCIYAVLIQNIVFHAWQSHSCLRELNSPPSFQGRFLITLLLTQINVLSRGNTIMQKYISCGNYVLRGLVDTRNYQVRQTEWHCPLRDTLFYTAEKKVTLW